MQSSTIETSNANMPTGAKLADNCARVGLRSVSFILFSVALAFFTYNTNTAWMLIFLPAVVLSAPTRTIAFLSIFCHYMALNWEEIPDAIQFFKASLLMSSAIWILHSLLMAIPWLIFYKRNITAKDAFVRCFLLLLVLMIPPLGLFIWVQPILSAGMLFPGLGFAGVMLDMVLMSVLAGAFCARKLRYAALAGVLLVLAALLNYGFVPAKVQRSWTAIDTDLGVIPQNELANTERQQEIIDAIQTKLVAGKKLILLPENIIDNWLAGTKLQFASTVQSAKSRGATILLGADIQVSPYTVQSGMAVLGARTGESFYPARQPMPGGEWNPFGKEHYPAHWFAPGVINISGRDFVYLICYEQMVPWLTLYSFALHHPAAILAPSNQWFLTLFAKGGFVKQQLSAKMFARLFNVPILTATNF